MCNHCGKPLLVCRCDSEAFYNEFHQMRSEKDYDQYRRTGRSTRQAISYILDCLNNPKRTYHIVDHFGTRQANVYLMERIQMMVMALGLFGFQFHKNTVSMRYDTPNLRGR